MIVTDDMIEPPAPVRPGQARFQAAIDANAATEAVAVHLAPRLRELAREFFAKRGRAPFDDLAATVAAARTLRAEAGAGLANPAQVEEYARRSRQLLDGEIAKMSRYATRQVKAWHDQTSEAVLGQHLADALAPWNGPATHAKALKAGRHEIAAHGARTGLAAAAIDRRQARFASDLTVAHTMRLAHSDTVAAIDFYHANRKRVADAARPGLEQRLDRAQADTLVDHAAGAILAGTAVPQAGLTGLKPSGPDPAAALPAWLDLADRFAAHAWPGDGSLRLRLRREIAGRVAEKRAAAAEAARRARNALMAAALGNPGAQPLSLADPGLHLAWIKAPDAVRDSVERRVARNRAGIEPQAGPAVVAYLHRTAGLRAAHPGAFRRVDLAARSLPDALPADLHRRLIAAQDADAAQPPDSGPALDLHALIARMAATARETR